MVLASSLPRTLKAAAKTAVFLLKVLPMLPSRPLDLVTPAPAIVRLDYATPSGRTEGEVYRPAGFGTYPGIVVCLGVVPFGVDHPQVPRLGEALARSGFAPLLYWSPAMRDFRLDPEDIEGIALAYERLIEQPYVDPSCSGLMGTCVGASFAIMAAAHERVRDRVAFVGAFAPYGSLFTLARDIASATTAPDGVRVPWTVDQLTRRVFVQSLTARLDSGERETLREAFTAADGAEIDSAALSAAGRAVHALLSAGDITQADRALRDLPADLRKGLGQISPLSHVRDVRAARIAISHDRDDHVIPVSQSRLLLSSLGGRPGFGYTEFELFEHADPTKRKLSPLRLMWQLARFYGWLYGLFRQAVT
jgi:dienelactone hydrolase